MRSESFEENQVWEVHHSLGGIQLGVWKGMEMAEVIRLLLHLTM